jgi:cytochrome c556
MSTRLTRRIPGRAAALGALAVLALLTTAPRTAPGQLRPLVRDMLDNLTAVNLIGQAVALDDWDRVEDSARELRTRAARMRMLDLAAIDIDPAQDPVWDAFLLAQEEASREISVAVRHEDARGVMLGTEKLVGNACLGCHATFRDPQNRLQASVLFMTSFLSVWRDMNRGMAIRDFNLIGMRARELEALTKVIASDQILEEAFRLGGTRQRRLFRGFLSAVTESATSIDAASKQEDLAKVLAASRNMFTEGCIACHQKFRR